jgi:RND family efflux transporter MFP subunit
MTARPERPSLKAELKTMSHEPISCPGRAPTRPLRAIAAAAAVAALVGCSSEAGRAAGPPAMPVEVITLAERPVEQATEFVGVVKSRQSTTVQPQVEGFVTRIRVRSGDRIAPGMPLIEIDPRMQEAAVASLESQVASRKADLQQARLQAERSKTLLAAGATSQAEAEQAETALATAQAQLQAAEAQLREQRVSLAYYTVSASTAGIVGDIPVRVGDRVTRSTVLTTLDRNAGLELYINVPVQEAANLKLGLPVHLVDDGGAVFATERLSFVSPSVDGATQSVLAKATLEKGEGLRTEQFVRARIVWSERPTLTAPVIALNRIGGQYFAYVAEGADAGTVARQRAVEPGPVVGNDYVIKSGLKPGERLIVSGVQRIADGAPVKVTPTATPAAPPAAKGS